MKIDWFTVIAQLINFLVLVWLLRRFLYQPVLDAVDAREKLIESEMSNAKDDREQAQQSLNALNAEKRALENRRQGTLDELRKEVDQERKVQMDAVRADSETLRSHLRATIDEEQRELADTVRDNIRSEVIEVAAKTLADLGSVSLNDQILQKFIGEISTLTATKDAGLKNAITASSGVLVESAFPISAALRAELKDAVNALAGTECDVVFDENAELSAGIELRAGNYLLSWNIEHYLNALDRQTGTFFKTKQHS